MQMCPEEDYSTAVEMLAIDDNWCENIRAGIEETKIMNTSVDAKHHGASLSKRAWVGMRYISG